MINPERLIRVFFYLLAIQTALCAVGMLVLSLLGIVPEPGPGPF